MGRSRGSYRKRQSPERNSSLNRSKSDLISWSSSQQPDDKDGKNIYYSPSWNDKNFRRKTFYIRNMKIQMTHYNEHGELAVEISDRYAPGLNYDHRFRMSSPNTFDEMESLIYMFSVYFGEYPLPKEEWVTAYNPRNGDQEYQYREMPPDFRGAFNEYPRRIVFRGHVFEELIPSFPQNMTDCDKGKGKGKKGKP